MGGEVVEGEGVRGKVEVGIKRKGGEVNWGMGILNGEGWEGKMWGNGRGWNCRR